MDENWNAENKANGDQLRLFDEAATDLLRTVPGFLRSFFVKLVEEGFKEEQAMELTKEYMKKHL